MGIVANLNGSERVIAVKVDPSEIGLAGNAFVYTVHPLPERPLPPDGVIRLPVPAKNFRLVEIRAAD
jgi:hypothetical protein